MTCPQCGARTDFIENADASQSHTCRNPACGFQFRMVEDNEDAP